MRAERLRTAALACVLAVAGCAGSAASPPGTSSAAEAGDGATLSQTPEAEETLETDSPGESAQADQPDATEADRVAGVLSREVPEVGDATFVTVAGSTASPDPQARVTEVAVQVEGGLAVDATAFADFVLDTLNDPRSWAADGRSFARVDDASRADVTVVLASPQTSADMCRPLVTAGRLSCRTGRRAVLTYYRWVNGQDDYGTDLTGYRHYVVNHEVGHFLGHGHKFCPGPGQLAPVMMQQTKGLQECLPNPWPYPDNPAPTAG
ncbi:MAG: DUF3152 domain-containing protein [Actinomycetales bacterium]